MSVVCVVSQIYRSFFPFHSKTLKNQHKVHGGGQSVTFSSTPPSTALALGAKCASAYLAVRSAQKNLKLVPYLRYFKYIQDDFAAGGIQLRFSSNSTGRHRLCDGSTHFIDSPKLAGLKCIIKFIPPGNALNIQIRSFSSAIHDACGEIHDFAVQTVKQILQRLCPTPARHPQAQYQNKPSHNARILMSLHLAISMFDPSNMLLLTVCYPSKLTGHHV